MEITIVASLFTKRDMKIDAGHFLFLSKLIHLRILFVTMILFAFGLSHSLAQQYDIVIHPESSRAENPFRLPKAGNEDDLRLQLSSKLDSLRSIGYLSASIDSIQTLDKKIHVYTFLGKKYQVNKVINDGVDEERFDFYFKDKEALSWQAIEQKKKDILFDYVNDGYIKAKASFKEAEFNGDSITVSLSLEKDNQFLLDSIRLTGDLEIKKQYLLSTFKIEEGEVLNEAFFNKINSQIENSKYIEMESPISFHITGKNTAVVYLPLEEKAANEFDLLIGFLPNPNPRITNNNLLVTGEGRLQLFNPFGAGREFFVDYKQLQPESPRLLADLYFPRFLDQNFGLQGSFELFKQDTSFVSLNGSFGVRYDFSGNQNLSITFEPSRSFLQTVDTSFVRQNQSLPPSVDFSQNLYETKYQWVNTNRFRNPSKGFTINATGAIGNRTITQNENITSIESGSFDFSSLYDGINNDKFITEFNFRGQYFIPVGKRNTVLVQNHTSTKQLNQYFENDLYRIGGFKTIRGFDEQSFLASQYTVNTAEYRFLLNESSFFSIFGDWALLDNQQLDTDNQLLGIGTGLDLSTQAGIFSMNLAVGQDNDNPFDFQRARLHLGYVNVF